MEEVKKERKIERRERKREAYTCTCTHTHTHTQLTTESACWLSLLRVSTELYGCTTTSPRLPWKGREGGKGRRKQERQGWREREERGGQRSRIRTRGMKEGLKTNMVRTSCRTRLGNTEYVWIRDFGYLQNTSRDTHNTQTCINNEYMSQTCSLLSTHLSPSRSST